MNVVLLFTALILMAISLLVTLVLFCYNGPVRAMHGAFYFMCGLTTLFIFLVIGVVIFSTLSTVVVIV